MSRVELAPSYLASQPVPAWCGTMRGATAPTAGSAKCGSSRSQPAGLAARSRSRGTRRDSVCAAASPVLRAAPGPPLTGPVDDGARRAAPRSRAMAAGSADASSTTMTRGSPRGRQRRAAQAGQAAVEFRVPVPDRDHDGHVGGRGTRVRRAADRAGQRQPGAQGGEVRVRDARVEQAAGQRAGAGPRPAPACPANQDATWRDPAGVSRSTRTGEPPTRTDPPATSRVPGSGRRRRPAGTARAVARRHGVPLTAGGPPPRSWSRLAAAGRESGSASRACQAGSRRSRATVDGAGHATGPAGPLARACGSGVSGRPTGAAPAGRATRRPRRALSRRTPARIPGRGRRAAGR